MSEHIMEVLYNGCYCGEELFNTILETQDIPMSYAQEKLEKMLFKGVNSNSDMRLTTISAVPIRAYPGNKKLWWNLKKSNIQSNVILKQISFINILVIKQIAFMLGSFIETFKWCFRNRKNKNKAMLSYSANPPVLLPMLLVCKLWRVKSIIIVTEIPKFRFFDGQTSWLRAMLLKIMINVSTWLHECFDGYIFLTEYMNEQVNKDKKPYIVVEGMVDVEETNKKEGKTEDKKQRMILYTGSLNEEYGIATLLEGFKAIDIKDAELVFCGSGNYQNEIDLISKNDERIHYLGMLSYNEVACLQQKAGFLINPRPTDSEFTKYSFPSKTLEYMLTETPVISTKLKGIPTEYDSYLNYIEDESSQGYANYLKKVLEEDFNKYKEQAKRGREFVIEKKNLKMQTKKIADFIQKLINY